MEINPSCQPSNRCKKGLLFLTEGPRDETSKALQIHIQKAIETELVRMQRVAEKSDKVNLTQVII